MRHDVIVVGSGAGGLIGALRAARNGLSVLLLEKSAVIGGTAALTGGGLWAPGNCYLTDESIDDVTQAQTYLDATVGSRTPRSMQVQFLEHAAPTVAWLGTLGIVFAWMPGFPDYHPDLTGGRLNGRAIAPKGLSAERAAQLQHSVRPKLSAGDGGPVIRAIDPKKRLWGGQSLVAQLLLACEEAGVEILVDTAMTGLVVDGDRVAGVQCGTEVFGASRGVLLAAGGLDHSPRRGDWQDASVAHGSWSLGVEGNTGDAIVAGIELGAATDLLEDSWWTPAFVRPDGGVSFLLWERLAPLGFIVDQDGRRWGNEGLPYNTWGHAALAARDAGSPCIPSWQVFDQHGLDLYGFGGLAAGEDPSPWVAAGALQRASSLPELGALLGAPALVETNDRWTVLAEKGMDEDFGRGLPDSYERQSLTVFQSYPGVVSDGHLWPNPSLAPLVRGPFYAAPVVLGDLGTKGGLVCDERGRVTRPDGSAIAGLYACGNTMASMMGNAYPGPGSCITPGMTFAVLAADHMAGEA